MSEVEGDTRAHRRDAAREKVLGKALLLAAVRVRLPGVDDEEKRYEDAVDVAACELVSHLTFTDAKTFDQIAKAIHESDRTGGAPVDWDILPKSWKEKRRAQATAAINAMFEATQQ